MDNSGIQFDAEGGFTTSGGFRVPAEVVKKTKYDGVTLARMFNGFALIRDANLDYDSLFRLMEAASEWTNADRANLVRIANATESIADTLRSLLPSLRNVLKDFAVILEQPAQDVHDRKKVEKEAKRAAKKKKQDRPTTQESDNGESER